MEFLRELTDTELEAVSGGVAAVAASTGSVAVAAATDLPSVSPLLCGVADEFSDDGPGAIAFTKTGLKLGKG